jgi:aspartyl protease
MPTYNRFCLQPSPPGQPTGVPHPQGMAVTGPVLEVQIEIPSVLAQSLQAANSPIPNSVTGIALIDTGASITSIDVSIATRLGLNPNGIAMVGTAGGAQQQPTYQARLSFPGTALPGFEHPKVLGCNLTGQMVMNQQPIIALIGRDYLLHCVFVYSGGAGAWSLSF